MFESPWTLRLYAGGNTPKYSTVNRGSYCTHSATVALETHNCQLQHRPVFEVRDKTKKKVLECAIFKSLIMCHLLRKDAVCVENPRIWLTATIEDFADFNSFDVGTFCSNHVFFFFSFNHSRFRMFIFMQTGSEHSSLQHSYATGGKGVFGGDLGRRYWFYNNIIISILWFIEKRCCPLRFPAPLEFVVRNYHIWWL